MLLNVRRRRKINYNSPIKIFKAIYNVNIDNFNNNNNNNTITRNKYTSQQLYYINYPLL